MTRSNRCAVIPVSILLCAFAASAQVIHQAPLTPAPLDPILGYSTYVGVNNLLESFGWRAVSSVDSAGNACIATDTVTKLKADGSLVYATVISTFASAVAIDSSGNCYVTGSGTVVTTPGAFQSTGPGQFVMKLNPAGQVAYSTYVRGNANDSPTAIAVDGTGHVYLTGSTNSGNYPVANPVQSLYQGGSTDAYVTELNPTGTALVFSTYLGGSGADSAVGIGVDGFGNIYVGGVTVSPNFPTTAGVIQPAYNSTSNPNGNAFVTKFTSAGAISYSTFLGGQNGPAYAAANALAVSGSGEAYIVGQLSPGFFLYGLNSTGTALLSSINPPIGNAIALDAAGNVYLGGAADPGTSSYPLVMPIQNFTGGDTDDYIAVLNSSGTVIFSTYFGGTGDDAFGGLGVDSSGNIYFSGTAVRMALAAPRLSRSSMHSAAPTKMTSRTAFLRLAL